MSGSIGSFEARQTNFTSADVRYQVVVFPDALVAVRTGGQFSGTGGHTAEAVLRHFGLVGAGLAALFGVGSGGSEEDLARGKELERQSQQQLLGGHEKNFRVALAEITRAGIEAQSASLHGKAVGRLTLELGPKEPVSLLLQSTVALAGCRALLSKVLGARLWQDPKLPALQGAAPTPQG